LPPCTPAGTGSGEALNEHVVGTYWPEAPERLYRLWEAVEVIKKLFSGKEVRHRGEAFTLEKTRLWTLDERPPIYVATAGPVTARRAGREADGFITPGAPVEKVAALIERFTVAAREAGKDPDGMPRIVQLHLSWAATDEEARTNAVREWPNGGMSFPKSDVRSPHDFEQMAKLVRIEDFEGRMVVSADPDVHREHIQRFLDAGVDRVYLHNVGRNQKEWIDVFAREVLPRLTR
jgi:coenzyme F420-dependent glucose-6-phosphate dehydrogenase